MFKLEKRFALEILDHARAEVPNECCGFLIGEDESVLQVYRCNSTEKSPYRYFVDSMDQVRVNKLLEEKGWDLLGVYHSHTHTEAYPSETDIERADEHRKTMLALLSVFRDPSIPEESLPSLYAGPLYFIISLKNAAEPVIRAFQITDGKITEEEVMIA